MKRRWIQFRLQTLLVMITVLCALLVLGLTGYRREQEFRRAWRDLAILDMGSTISSDIRLHSRRASWSNNDVDKLLRIIEALSRRRDFGFTSGKRVAVIDFKGSQISDESLATIRQALPSSTVCR